MNGNEFNSPETRIANYRSCTRDLKGWLRVAFHVFSNNAPPHEERDYERPDIPMPGDLSKDPREVSNVAKQFPETQKRLFGQMMGHLNQVDDRFPKENPDYDLEVYKKLKNYDKYMKWGAFEGKRPLEDDEI